MGTAVLGFGIYNSVVFFTGSSYRLWHEEDASGISPQAQGTDDVVQPGGHANEAYKGKNGNRRPFRQLDMFGESDTGDEDDWKVCKTYREIRLKPHKKEGQRGFDKELKPVQPGKTTAWNFEITESMDVDWLGLHRWDDRFEHGSEEADRRVKKMGYCRIHMPSVPRTGSTWFRAMFEAVTGQHTFSMWPENGSYKKNYIAFSSDDPCGASLDHMEGLLHSKKVYPCRHVRQPNGTSPILYKSHTPFFPSYNKPTLLPEDTCMVLLLIRNPIDNQDAWMRYMIGKGEIFRNYMPLWEGHILHWIAGAAEVPIYVFRYEDMLFRPREVLRRIMNVLPGGWQWSEESIDKALRMYGPKKPFEEKCGSGFDRSSLAEVEVARRHYSGTLGHFGYRFVRQGD